MSYFRTTLGDGTDDKYVNVQSPDSVFKYLQGQCYDQQTPYIEPTKSNSWGTFHTSGSGPYYQSSAFTPQSTDKDCKNALASLIPSPQESQNSFSSGPCFSHNNTSPTDDESWKDWITLQPMSNTATHGFFCGPCESANCYHANNFFSPPDSTLGDQNIDPSLDSTMNLLPPFHLVSNPDQPLEQALQFAGNPNFPEIGFQPHFHYQALPENGNLYINQAKSSSREEGLGIYSQYNPARGEIMYPLSCHLPRSIEHPATSPVVSQNELTNPSVYVSQRGLLQSTVPPWGNSSLTTSHTSSRDPHISSTQYSNRHNTNAKPRGVRTCSHCLDPSHNIAQCPLRACRFCGQMGHVSGNCAARKRKNMDHRRDATRRRRHMTRDMGLGTFSNRVELKKSFQE